MRRESELQKVVLNWLAFQPKTFAWRTANHSVYDAKRKIYRKKSAHDLGLPDIFFIKNGRVIAVELKSEKGKMSPFQIQWAGRYSQCGGVFWCANSLKDVMEIWDET